MRKVMLVVLTALVAIGIFAPSAIAGGSEVCTTGGCEFKHATFTPESIVVEKSHGQGKSVTNISIRKVKRWKHKYEKRKHVRVNIFEKEKGSSSTSCVDPTKMGWGFHAGDGFKNHGENGLFPAKWVAGWEICDYRIVKKGGRTWATGEKKNCGNTPIWIPIHFHVRRPRIKTIEVKSWTVFYLKFVKHVHITRETTSEGENIVERGRYTCPAGWELVGDNTCKHCPPPQCEPQCEYGSVWNGYECVKDGSTTPPPPTEAPGPNPPPSGGEGDPGSNQCYDEETGEPVQPREGLCPPGSYGEY